MKLPLNHLNVPLESTILTHYLFSWCKLCSHDDKDVLYHGKPPVVMTTSCCTQIVESLFALMYKSAVDRPVLPYQEGLSQLQRSGAEDDCEIPCATDPSWQHNCSVTMEGRTALVIQESGPGYAIGLLPFTNGRYTWKVQSYLEKCDLVSVVAYRCVLSLSCLFPKVSTETTKPAFFVGLALKRLTPKGIQSSNDVWVLDAASGRLYHGGEQGETLFVMSDGGDTFTVEFDSVAKTLSFGKNSEPLKVAFNEISKPGEELFPALFFNKKSGTTRVSASGYVRVGG